MIEHLLGEDRAMSSIGRGIVLRQIDRLFRDGILGGLGDGQLLDRYRTRRDETAFEALVDLHGPMVLGLCRRMLRDPRDIEDAFQATFLVLVRKAPAIRDGNLLSSWLYGVAYRVARRARTQTLRRRGHEAPVAELEVAARPESTDRSEIDPVLDQELDRLPEKYRAPLILCYLRGRTHDQAAEELRCPVGTVRSRLARGRDLLKKRLTRRGFAPSATAAILGTGHGLPAMLLVEVVPPSLLSATVKTAFGFGSAQTIQSGAVAATALALAQGVLMTMKLAQLKWIGLAVLATSLSAGGVAAVSSAAYQEPIKTASDKASSVELDEPQSGVNPDQLRKMALASRDEAVDGVKRAKANLETAQAQVAAAEAFVQSAMALRDAAEAALKSIEEAGNPDAARTAFERARTQLTATEARFRESMPKRVADRTAPNLPRTPVAQQDEPPRPTQHPDRPDLEPRRDTPARSNPARELEVQLRFALAAFDRTEALYRNNAVAFSDREEARGKVLILAAQLEGLDEDLADEVARLNLELRRKQAARDKAEAQEEVASYPAARNHRLNQRKQGTVSAEDVAKAEGELKVAKAGLQIANAEVAEVELRILQLRRRRDRIKTVITLADRAKAAASK
jgi:RNA polymerase sigma factor (sigma-70 family)